MRRSTARVDSQEIKRYNFAWQLRQPRFPKRGVRKVGTPPRATERGAGQRLTAAERKLRGANSDAFPRKGGGDQAHYGPILRKGLLRRGETAKPLPGCKAVPSNIYALGVPHEPESNRGPREMAASRLHKGDGRQNPAYELPLYQRAPPTGRSCVIKKLEHTRSNARIAWRKILLQRYKESCP